MAEGFLRHLAPEHFDVHSAGTSPTAVNPSAIVVMWEKGIDISAHRSKNVAEYLGRRFQYIVTVCDDANEGCPIFPGPSIRLHWSFPDPAKATGTEEERLSVFRKVRDEIESRIREFVASAGISSVSPGQQSTAVG